MTNLTLITKGWCSLVVSPELYCSEYAGSMICYTCVDQFHSGTDLEHKEADLFLLQF